MKQAVKEEKQMLSATQTADRIDRIASFDPTHAETIRNNRTSFELTHLPFYRDVSLLRAEVFLPHRPIELRFAEAGGAVRPIARRDQIDALNRDQSLDLSAEQASAYLSFYVESVGGLEYRLLQSANDVRWLPKSAPGGDAELAEQRLAATVKIHAPRVESINGAYRVTVNGIRGKGLFDVTFSVTRSGRVDLLAAHELMSDLPVPYAA